MQVNAKDVMTLRARTGLGMMDCKKALAESGGDLDAAEESLRKKLKGKMEGRTERAAGEGAIAIAVSDDGRAAAIVEFITETDFTAKNESFHNATQKLAQIALKGNAGDVAVNDEMKPVIDDVRITTGENAQYARGHKLEGGGDTMFGSYIHHDGKTGVLIQAEGNVSLDILRDICMHITAAVPRPLGVGVDDIPADVVEKEKKFALEQAMESGKPREIAEMMVEGKMRKFYEGVALLEQPFVKDPDKTIKQLLPKGATVVGFLRWTVGETAA
ncbi:MAG: translation elongation factor Ts [Phycisphaeraceae bacterium]|nr:translation elongation factor Ts [Phycisphaeraceae bacterium]